ncbi:MAG: thiol reductant ABC exporter subunit CydD [Pseudomonadota bacterium]
METNDKSTESRAIGWLLGRARAVVPWIGLSVAAGLSGGLLLVVQAAVLSQLVAAVFMDGRRLPEMAIPLAVFLGITGLRALMAWAREVSGFQAGAVVRESVRRDLLQHLADLGPDFTARTPAGALASAAVEQVEALQPFFARYLPQLALAALIPGAILAFVFPVSWAAGGLFLLTAPLIPLFMVLVGMGAETISQRHFQALARMSGHFLDLLRGMTTLKLFGRSRSAEGSVRQVARDYRVRTMAVLRIAFLSSAVLEFFTSMAIALVAVYLGMSYLGYLDFGTYGERLSFAHGFFILLLAPEFFLPLRELGQHYHARADAAGAAEELMRVLAIERTSFAIAPTALPFPAAPHIRFESVDLSYGSARKRALSAVTLDIPFGQHTAVVGESGAGKTSLINLLLGFVAPERGRILVGGAPLPLIDLTAWRRQLAWIGQHPVVFYGTIADNIRLGRPEAAPGEIAAAAERAGVLSFIRTLPHGLDTRIGEQGAGLSRGQAQRVALARVFLRDAPIVLLDEPLASLDMDTERQVSKAISDFSRGRTLVMLTHRLDTIQRVDQVVVMDAGRVAFQGTPAEYRRRRLQECHRPLSGEVP